MGHPGSGSPTENYPTQAKEAWMGHPENLLLEFGGFGEVGEDEAQVAGVGGVLHGGMEVDGAVAHEFFEFAVEVLHAVLIAVAHGVEERLAFLLTLLDVLASAECAFEDFVLGLFESCLPPSEFESPWPAGVPVQIHGMNADPFFAGEGDIDAAHALVDEADDAELFVYPGDRHLFSDSSLSTYDADATALLTERVLKFLARV